LSQTEVRGSAGENIALALFTLNSFRAQNTMVQLHSYDRRLPKPLEHCCGIGLMLFVFMGHHDGQCIDYQLSVKFLLHGRL
jgi:hypothetical protein